MNNKSIYVSKTFIFNVAAAVAAILALPQVLNFIPADALPYVVMVQSVVNIILRRFTDEPARFVKP